MTNIEHGPYEQQISDGIDFYKASMSQVAYNLHPETSVTFALKNRNNTEPLLEYIDPQTLQARLDTIASRGFSGQEVAYLASVMGSDGPLFSAEYLDYLADTPLPPTQVAIDESTNDIAISASGDWPIVSFWETVVMSEVNELYFETFCRKNNIDVMDLYDEGDAKLTEKIAILKETPGIRFSDFGTRRHFSYRWQKHVVERLQQELPGQFIGTSNIGLSKTIGMQPIGTFAHEMPMVYAAIADTQGTDIKASHGEMLDDWHAQYGEDLAIALTDTFGSDFFFADFGAERAAAWRGVRHDSGDPIAFGEKTIAFYAAHGIDPTTKTIVFSDGLDCKEIVHLYQHFNGRVRLVFGWGTTLTNDLGIPALNIVMKAVAANGESTVKLSDVAGKHTGTPEKIAEYRDAFAS